MQQRCDEIEQQDSNLMGVRVYNLNLINSTMADFVPESELMISAK